MKTTKHNREKLTLQSGIFTRGVDDIITKDELEKLLASKKQLRIKLGIDATSSDLHIGHAVPLWKIRALQDAGHKAVIILGEFTTRIGDPTGKDAARPVLTAEVIRRNVAALKKQLGSILLTDKTHFEFRSNAEWHGKMKEWDFLNLCAMVTHSRLIERDMFQERIKKGKEIAMTELLYPLLQGYDSVAIKSDITIIGSDQLFNEHFGRFFQEKFGQPPQAIVTLKILPGLDGGPKMSKSLGNYIGLNDTPADKFGKAMRLLDSLIIPYLEVYTDMPTEQIARIGAELKGGMNPRDAKLIFAETLVERYHGEQAAIKAREQFLAVFSKKELPEEIKEMKVNSDNIIEILFETGFATSKGDARRLLKQGGVEVDGKRIDEKTIKIEKKNGIIFRVGKRKIAKLLF
ncbi:MAG: tyrosine--tRNA ligase [Candidatus Sungbacteria bacterium]|nr:tyrosine--tRNA ligase [Candidatus Sungbacteria bacterium]